MPEILSIRSVSGDIDGVRFLKRIDEIRGRSGENAFIASVNLSCVCSAEHLLSVFEKAVRSFRSGRSRSRTAESEFFRILAMEPQLNRAIEKCGMAEKASEFCLVYEGILPEEIAALLEEFRTISIEIPPCNPEKLSSMGFESIEELLEATAFFDAGIWN